MGQWEKPGKSDDWYTPKYIFDALGCRFDLDPANAAIGGAHVPCDRSYGSDGLEAEWEGFVWLNPPFGGRNGLLPWLQKFAAHRNGIVLVPDRTSAPWFQYIARQADRIIFLSPKVKFERPDGSLGKRPATGTALLAIGARGVAAIENAAFNRLGFVAMPFAVLAQRKAA